MGVIKGVHTQIDHLAMCMLKWRQTKKNNQSWHHVIYTQGCLSSMNNQWALGNFESLFNTKVLLRMFENRVPEKKKFKKGQVTGLSLVFECMKIQLTWLYFHLWGHHVGIIQHSINHLVSCNHVLPTTSLVYIVFPYSGRLGQVYWGQVTAADTVACSC